MSDVTRKLPEHGQSNRYAYGCRCGPCTKAAVRADAQRRLDRLAGRPRRIPSGPVAEHIRALTVRLTPQQIAREAGVTPATVYRLASGEQKMLFRSTAEKLLAVTQTVRVSRGDVPAIGATRRLRALYALGHYNWQIAQDSGLSRDAICALVAGDWATLKVAHDDAVRSVYDRLSMSVGTSWKTRNHARRNGWAPPLAWDEDAIDDPNAVPHTDDQAPTPTEGENAVDRYLMGESVILGTADRRKLIGHLMEWTDRTVADIAAELEMKPDALSRAWERIKERARKAGGPVPWRRLYKPAQREATTREKEAA